MEPSDPPTAPSTGSPGSPGTGPTTFEAVWREHQRHLEGLATRILGDRAAAEDVTQDAFGRLMATDLAEIRDVRGWLTVVVRRLCLNRIRSAYSRREQATDAGPLEPHAAGAAGDLGADPADRLTLDDQVRSALSVVLDELSPAERTAFLLHDVFGLPHTAVGQTVGRSPAACRQLVSRARRTVQAAGPQPDIPADMSSGEALVVERFLAACAHGDLDGLVALLDPDVTGEAWTADGERLGAFRGGRAVGGNILARYGPRTGALLIPVPIEEKPGVVALLDGRVQAIVAVEVRDGLIRNLEAVVLVPDRASPG